ncbi:hypothetical protein [Oceanispirochaeta sp.]|jgi:hypothetical protein|uniref:hypothetical protein n=1 Tax=Oceanispirochaeta sp. TaxID=2035350 RepID=UPI002637678A|nr:hypothetical protein [Oceanispirochaeta sp.]MDA3956261.1 hypothetical protein [Oceanispirochaeta sp.]
MNKRYCILLFCFATTIGNLLSGETILNNDHTTLLPVDNVIPGITKVEEINELGKYVHFTDGSGKLVESYRLAGSTVYYEQGIITKIKGNKSFALPQHWRTLGLNWDLDTASPKSIFLESISPHFLSIFQ